MATPAQMFDNELNILKGSYFAQPWTVDKTCVLKSGETVANAKAGRVVSLSTTAGSGAAGRQWVIGTGTTSPGSAPLPFILIQGAADFDVLGDDGNIVGAAAAGALLPRLTGIAVTNAAEVETTGVNSSYTTPAPGDLLVSDNTGQIVKANTGAVSTGSPIALTILGVVSDGLVTSEHKRSLSLLRFHTCYVPRFA